MRNAHRQMPVGVDALDLLSRLFGGSFGCLLLDNFKPRHIDAAHANERVLLPVANVAAAVLALFELADFKLLALILGANNLGGYGGTVKSRGTDLARTATIRQQYAGEGDRRTRLDAVAVINKKFGARLDTILPAAVFEDGEHSGVSKTNDKVMRRGCNPSASRAE